MPYRENIFRAITAFLLEVVREGNYCDYHKWRDCDEHKTNVEISRKQAGVGHDEADVKVDETEVRQECLVLLWKHILGNCGKLTWITVGSECVNKGGDRNTFVSN